MSHWTADSRRSDLARALYDAARKPLEEVFRKRDSPDQVTFKILAEAAKELEPGDWVPGGYNSALREAIRRAIKAMPEEDGPRDYSTMTWREIAATLYGLKHGDEAATVRKPKTYDRRYEVVKRHSFLESTALRDNVIVPTWPLLADAFASLQPDSTESPTAASPGHTPNSLYVPRQQLHDEFKAAVAAGAKVIVLVGLAGVGKTWLAKELTKSPNGDEAPIVRVNASEPKVGDIEATNPDGHAATNPDARLANLLCRYDAPAFVILDGLESSDDLVAMLPSFTKSVVVATCRRIGLAPPSNAVYITVEAMTRDESSEVVQKLIPTATEDEATALAVALYDYPLAIRYSCSLIASQGISIASFIEEIAEDRVALIERAYTQEQTTVLVVLRRMLTAIRDCDDIAHELLLFLIFHNFGIVACTGFLKRYLDTGRGNPLSMLRYRQAVDTLNRFRVIDVGYIAEEQRNYYGSDTAIVIHKLTREILCLLLHEEAEPAYIRFFRSLESLANELHGKAISFDSPERDSLWPLWCEARSASESFWCLLSYSNREKGKLRQHLRKKLGRTFGIRDAYDSVMNVGQAWWLRKFSPEAYAATYGLMDRHRQA